MATRDHLDQYALFCFGNRSAGIGQWLASKTAHDLVVNRLAALDQNPLTKVQFNQLLVASQAASVSDGFFKYYWKLAPERHPYDVTATTFFDDTWTQTSEQTIIAHNHLKWGLNRLFIDTLLFFGNVKAGFDVLRSMELHEIEELFQAKRFDAQAIAARGPSLPLQDIAKDDRYLISEMACKTFGDVPEDANAARCVLQEALRKHRETSGGNISFRSLLEQYVIQGGNKDQLLLSYDEVLNDSVDSDEGLNRKFDSVLDTFLKARSSAIANTAIYLSMVNDLDVYVATSMRTRQNFRDMAAAAEAIFKDARLKHLHLRYFDPTMSAAKGHEDKGLIECLMVKCAKVLVYCEGEKESYGKDAEAAMALSLGKPVIFFCDHGKKTNFYRDVHPLARLIDFRSGVAVGAIVTDKVEQVSELLRRIFENKMQYRLEHHPSRNGYLKLVEVLTDSVVRLQTNDELLTTTFWNHYNNTNRRRFTSLAAGKEVERLKG